MTDPENEASSWWSVGVVGPRPWEDLQRRGDAPSPDDPLWRFTNGADGAVVLDAPGHEPTAIAPEEAVEFLACEGNVLAVADRDRPGVVLALGPVERLAEPSPSSRPPRSRPRASRSSRVARFPDPSALRPRPPLPHSPTPWSPTSPLPPFPASRGLARPSAPCLYLL